jgi:uncharacterized protein YycO
MAKKTVAKLITYRDFSESWSWTTKVACKGIQVWTRSKYFHTEVWIDGYRITADTRLGVIIRTTTNWDHVKKYADIKEIEIQEDKIKEALDFAYSQEGKEYDWKGICFSQFIPADIHDKEKWFCNEISGEVLKKAGAKGIVKDTNEYNPGSFQELF